MNLVFEQYQEEICQQSIDELHKLMPEVLTSEEYENMYNYGLQGVVVVLEEVNKLSDFSSLVQSFPSLSKEDLQVVDMHLRLISGYMQMPSTNMVVSEGLDESQHKVIAVENMNVLIVTAIATTIALIIKFWDRIFAFLFSPTETSKKMAASAGDIKKDIKAVNVKNYVNSTIAGKSQEQLDAYKNGKFISKSTFLHKYGKHGKNDYTIPQVIEAYDNYDSIAKDGGFADKVISALYEMAEFYMSDNFYKVLETIVVEIEEVSKKTPTIKNIDLSNVGSSVIELITKFITQEAAAYNRLLTLFPSTEDKGQNVTEYHTNFNESYGIFTNLYFYITSDSVGLKSETSDRNIRFRKFNSSIPGPIKNPDLLKVDLPGPDDRGAASEKYLARFNASYGEKDGTFKYSGFGKHSQFQKGSFKSSMENHSKKLQSLAERAVAHKSSYQSSVMTNLINTSKSNLNGILAVVNAIFTQTYEKDIKDAEKLIKEIRSHDRDTVTK